MNNWLLEFDATYGKLLDPVVKKPILNMCQRREGFNLIFKLLLSFKKDSFEIIETGTLRNPGAWTDGQSAFLFSKFVDHFGGVVRSVDISQEACLISKSFINSNNFFVDCSDSIEWLKTQNLKNADLFYLDSYDVKFKDDADSAEHHLNEFLIIEPFLKENSIVVIDDNVFLEHGRSGKGRKVYKYLADKNIFPVYDKYQIIYKF